MSTMDDFVTSLSEADRDALARRALKDAVRKHPKAVYPKPDEAIDHLKERYRALMDVKEFKAGDLVCWKPGLKNRKRPAVGEPAIVIDLLPEPRHDEQRDAGSPYFWEPLDLVLGLFDEDEEFMIYHFDSRRFQPFERA